jgi:hypothetical protein
MASIFRVHECELVTELTTSLCNQLALVGVSYEFVPIQELTTSLCNHLALLHPEEPHGVISQKMIIIIVTAVETSNLTFLEDDNHHIQGPKALDLIHDTR